MRCTICPHRCELKEGKTGLCGSRTAGDASSGTLSAADNESSRIISLNYGQITSLALDPIEKKPLRKFRQGSRILSVGSWGCNMRCPWCQNDSISRGPASFRQMTPEELAGTAARLKEKGNIGLAFTYNEPLISPEFLRDTAGRIHSEGMVNVLVSNGMSDPEMFRDLAEYIDAANIDLKTFSRDKYRKIGGDLDAVLANIKTAAEKMHLEVTNLIVPGFNDSQEEIREIAAFLAGIDRNIVLHVTRFHPAGDMRDVPATDVALVCSLAETASHYLDNVYTGNC